MDCRITVLMGVYNCASTLREALDSLLAQTYQAFKVVICDDGSTDDTYLIAKEYSDRNDNFVLIRHEENKGLNVALNYCLQFADTEFCARMDGDDISLPNRFEEEVRFLDEHPEYAFVSCPMHYFDESGIFRTGVGGYEPDITAYPKSSPFCHASCMVRTLAYRAVGGYREKEGYVRMEDYLLWLDLKVSGFRGYILEEPLYMMRNLSRHKKNDSWSSARTQFALKNMAVTKLGLPFYYRLYSLRPLLVFLLPNPIYCFLHTRGKRFK